MLVSFVVFDLMFLYESVLNGVGVFDVNVGVILVLIVMLLFLVFILMSLLMLLFM